MNSPYLTAITREGDRWDLLAWRYYGDPTLYGPIIESNPNLLITGAFDAGVVVRIPILQKASDISNDLPPWETL